MKNQQPTMAELMVGTPRSSSNRNADQGIEKAAAQAQVGEIFEGLTKEAKDDLIGTMGWAGKVFGEQIAAALEPTMSKLATLVTDLNKVAKTNLKNMEQVELYRDGKSSGPNPGGLPAKIKNPHTHGNDANVAAVATPTSQESPGGKGWSEIQSEKKRLLQAKTLSEQGKTGADASHVLANLRGGKAAEPEEGCEDGHEEKKAELAAIGKRFGDALKQDLQNQ